MRVRANGRIPMCSIHGASRVLESEQLHGILGQCSAVAKEVAQDLQPASPKVNNLERWARPLGFELLKGVLRST